MLKLNQFFVCMTVFVMSTMLYESALAQGEVTRSGSTWTARVSGSTVYTGSRMFDAVNATCNNMGTGTINIRNSGDSGPDGGNVYAIRPQANQILDFHGNTVNCNGGDLVVAIHADRRNGITIRNLRVTGNPRYGMWFRGCSNITLTNTTMNLSNNSPVGLGIRVDASTGSASNLTINGTTTITGSRGHGIETYSVNGVNIGNVTVNNTGGCGVLLNDSDNCTVGVITGDRNNQGGGYATFRVANNNRRTTVQGVYSRNSGRGFFSVSGSRDCTINWVDIANTTSHGIFLEDATNTHVLSGTVANGNPNCQQVRTTNCSINVTGCGGSGTPPPSGGAVVSGGTYRITPRHSGKAVDVESCGTGNGTNVRQWSWLNNNCQKWVFTSAGSGIWRISPANATGQALDVTNCSGSNSANIQLWSWLNNDCQKWELIDRGGGWYSIRSRASGRCLDVSGNSTGDGANIVQYSCNSSSQNQQFRFESVSAARMAVAGEFEDERKEIEGTIIFPNPVTNNILNIRISETYSLNLPKRISVYSNLGQLMRYEEFSGSEFSVDISNLPHGIYIIKLENGSKVTMEKIYRQ